MDQFNTYKYNELIQKFNNLSIGLNEKSIQMGHKIIEEWCWTTQRSKILTNWKQQRHQPTTNSTNLTILHYNIRNFLSNQCELLEMIERFKPAVISINELGREISLKFIEKVLFSYKIFKAEGTNSHGGAVLAIDKRLNPLEIDLQQQPNIVAASIMVNNKPCTLISVYSPPKEPLPLSTISNILPKSQTNIILGDLNAKNQSWGCTQVNKKDKNLIHGFNQRN